VGLGELLRGFLDGVGAFGVGPDDKSALVRAVVAAVATARGRHTRDCGDTCDRWSAAESHGVFLPGGLSEVVHAVHRRTRVRCGHAWWCDVSDNLQLLKVFAEPGGKDVETPRKRSDEGILRVSASIRRVRGRPGSLMMWTRGGDARKALTPRNRRQSPARPRTETQPGRPH